MSLKDPDDEYDELVPQGKGKLNKFLKKMRPVIIVLVVGIIVGAYIQYAYVSQLINGSVDTQSAACLTTKDLLNKENACLYSLVPNAKAASQTCWQGNKQTTQSQTSTPLVQIVAKDFNEEPA